MLRPSFLLALAAAAGAITPALPAEKSSDLVALRAGTAHLVEDGRVLEGGVTILVRDGLIEAIGADIAVPPNAQVVDYGPDAVVIPGIVAAASPLGLGRASTRSAEPGLSAVDGFDWYARNAWELSAGVTSAYVQPAAGRLIAGQGSVVKLAGADREHRLLAERAAIQGSIASDARRTPGHWDPPLPATVDVGLGRAYPQLPRSITGAIWSLGVLIDAAEAGEEAADFGPHAAGDLAPLLDAGLPWRIRAEEEPEIRALARFAAERDLELIVEGAGRAGSLGPELADANASVVVRLPFTPNASGRRLGKGPDEIWPRYDVAARLVEAGVRVAFAADSPRQLRFAASLGSRGGLDAAAALRAITLSPAEMHHVDERVGSIAVGKDADFAVLNGPPLGGGSSVVATWIDGAVVWSSAAHQEDGAVVIDVDELHLGNGEVLEPGQVLMRGGKIAEVGRRVARPAGATVVRGRAAMPGMIDALGYLGLEGSSKVPATDFDMERIVGPGDHVDRRVARAGVTTVVMSPRKASRSGAPMMAYKPAATDFDGQVVESPAALRVRWSSTDRSRAGGDVMGLLQKAVEYHMKWSEYEQAMARWVPPVEPPAAPAEKKAEDDDEAEAEAANGAEAKAEESKDDGKKKRRRGKKKKKERVFDPDPITGIWLGSVVVPPAAGEERVRFQLRLEDGAVEGWLRCGAVSDSLMPVKGTFELVEPEEEDGEKSQVLAISGLGSRGYFTLRGTIEGEDLEAPVLKAVLEFGAARAEFEASRQTRDYPVAERTERRRPEKVDEPKPPKGKPKQPKLDAKLEPVRRAILGETVIVCEVSRSDEILACVAAFEAVGIRPVLLGASGIRWISDDIAGRVRGVLLSHRITDSDPEEGVRLRNRFAELQQAGIPVAFHSAAEEGAADLPLMAAYAVSEGMSPEGAMRSLTLEAAWIMGLEQQVGRIARGYGADVLLLDGSPLDPSTRVLRTFVNGVEVH
jgi:imidazolonepropionase-like amidohydrolase